MNHEIFGAESNRREVLPSGGGWNSKFGRLAGASSCNGQLKDSLSLKIAWVASFFLAAIPERGKITIWRKEIAQSWHKRRVAPQCRHHRRICWQFRAFSELPRSVKTSAYVVLTHINQTFWKRLPLEIETMMAPTPGGCTQFWVLKV